LSSSGIVVATDKWRGSWSSAEAGAAIGDGVRRARPEAVVEVVAVADGGEGTIDALLGPPRVSPPAGAARIGARVTGPSGAPVDAEWAQFDADRGLIEIARAAGHALLLPRERDPLKTTTRGVGELVSTALDRGCASLTLALGGSATVDGGAGFAQALGFRLLDTRGREIAPGGGALLGLHAIEADHVDARLGSVRFEAWCDVRNPLLGPNGAARVFAPQKGADAVAVEQLERGLEVLARVIERDLGKRVADLESGGAAGGLGAAAAAFVNAALEPGAERVLKAVDFDSRLDRAALVITGEGRFDGASMPGKLVSAVADRAAARGIPVVLICGRDARVDPSDRGSFAAVLSGEELVRSGGELLSREDLSRLGARAVEHARLVR